ncbi:MAG: hypothetical protein LBT54_07085 [Bifidobacteriaceae bacterium]|nr:hypothetical protein [Bifidobacteriaceae bacterium]
MTEITKDMPTIGAVELVDLDQVVVHDRTGARVTEAVAEAMAEAAVRAWEANPTTGAQWEEVRGRLFPKTP